jgi:hypothetical protein
LETAEGLVVCPPLVASRFSSPISVIFLVK